MFQVTTPALTPEQTAFEQRKKERAKNVKALRLRADQAADLLGQDWPKGAWLLWGQLALEMAGHVLALWGRPPVSTQEQAQTALEGLE